MNQEQVEFRLTVEALRAGTATKSAAKHVGTTQNKVLEEFRGRLLQAESGEAVTPLVIGGPFGAGKSHLMQCLRAEAIAAGFVVSLVSIGPEAPLNNLQHMVRALAGATEANRVVGRASRELALHRKIEGEKIASLAAWVKSADLDSRFSALLELYQGFYADDEFRLRIIEDFEGKPMLNTEVRSRLKKIQTESPFVLESASGVKLAPQRLRFLPQLFRALGQGGWVLLLDEVEVLGRFGLRQRLAAYQNIGRIVSIAQAEGSRLVPVLASTDGSYLEFISEDEANVRAGLYYPDEDSRREAIKGLEIFKKVRSLVKPGRAEVMEILYRVKTIYDVAYGVRTSDPRIDNELLGYQVRTQIRNWVTQWDLQRFYPTDPLTIESGEVTLVSTPIGDELQVDESDLEG